MTEQTIPLQISSEGGRIFNFEWTNSIPSINLTKSSFDSICGRYSIAKAHKQYGFCSYWGGTSFGEYLVRTKMILNGIVWMSLEISTQCVIISRDGGTVTITDNQLLG
jgi:hypothetical protein